MSEKTCAARGEIMVGDTIKVTIGGRTVEVCCEECARKLTAAKAAVGNSSWHPTRAQRCRSKLRFP